MVYVVENEMLIQRPGFGGVNLESFRRIRRSCHLASLGSGLFLPKIAHFELTWLIFLSKVLTIDILPRLKHGGFP